MELIRAWKKNGDILNFCGDRSMLWQENQNVPLKSAAECPPFFFNMPGTESEAEQYIAGNFIMELA